MYAILRRRRLWIPTKDSTFVGPNIFDPKIAVFFKSFSSKKSSPGVCRNDPENHLTVSYLINTCGLSSEEAILASKKLRIKSPERPDEVLELLRKYGFTNAQIPKLVTRWPFVLGACPKNNLLPKLEFFRSIGVPPDVLAQNLSLYPVVLQRSLENSVMPFYNFLKSIVLSDKRFASLFSRAPLAVAHGRHREIITNIAILRERGLPESSITFLLAHYRTLMVRGKHKFPGYVDRADEMGFDRKKKVFVHALLVFGCMSESTLKRKMDVYRQCGWSESNIDTAFLKHPLCMKYSEKKIMATMDFLVNKMGFEPGAVAQRPLLLGFSLEKRIKPRCLVLRILNAKGLLKKKTSIASLLIISEDVFMKKCIVDYKDDIPQLLEIYQGKLSLDEMGIGQD